MLGWGNRVPFLVLAAGPLHLPSRGSSSSGEPLTCPVTQTLMLSPILVNFCLGFNFCN